MRFFSKGSGRAGILVISAAIVLSGCAMGIQAGGDSPSVSYNVPRSYQTVFLRAQNQANECLRGKNQYTLQAKVDPVTESAVVSVVAPLGGAVVARTELKATDAKHTQVTQSVWGHSPWDENALHAMRESIRLDTSVCFAYK